MSIYRYGVNSAIEEVVFHHAPNRLPVAWLASAPEASPDQLSATRLALDAAGWQSVPVYAEDRSVLQVSGFEKDADVNNLLREHRLTEGEAAITHQKEDEARPDPAAQVRNKSLKLAGLFNLVGNTGLVLDGLKKRDPYRITGGTLLSLSALNLVRYGNARPEHYAREAAEDLAGFIREQGGSISKESPLFDIDQRAQSGALGDAESFLYRHPAQISLGVSSAGASALLLSGLRNARHKEGWGGLGFGIGSLGLKLASLLIPEKSKDEIEARAAGTSRNPVQKAIDTVQEKPLRVYGLGSLATDVFLGIDAYQQYRRNPGKSGYIYTAAAGASYMLSDIMFSISSKDHVNDGGKFNADEQRGLEAMAASSLALEPEAARAPAAQKLGQFLESRKEAQGDAADISRSILEQARHLQENPWVSRAGKAEPGPPAR